ncbi:hypothetical protein ATR1_213c0001, partial [Acetobacter tropicalis]
AGNRSDWHRGNSIHWWRRGGGGRISYGRRCSVAHGSSCQSAD